VHAPPASACRGKGPATRSQEAASPREDLLNLGLGFDSNTTILAPPRTERWRQVTRTLAPPVERSVSHGLRLGPNRSGSVTGGAMATLSEVEKDSNVAARLPVLTRALLTLSNVRVRNVARVGGTK